jgi:hypothetical protein
MRKQCGARSGRQGKVRLLLLLGLAVLGCGRSTATVSGHVRYQGSPLPAGTVTFYGPNYQLSQASIQTDGSYTATKVPLGAVKVAVTTPQPMSKNVEKALQKWKKGWVPPDVNTGSLPSKYHDPERSGLELTVTGGSQPFEIELK